MLDLSGSHYRHLPLSSAACAGLQHLVCDPEAAVGSTALFAGMPALEELYLDSSMSPLSKQEQAALLAGLVRAPQLQQLVLDLELVEELGGQLEEWKRQLPGVRVYYKGSKGWPRLLVMPALKEVE